VVSADEPCEHGGVSRGPSAGRFAAHALWLGLIGFGGGFAVAQRIKHTVVDDEKWLAESEFVELFAVSNAMPGTSSTNLVTMLGLRFNGVTGAFVAVAAFLAPSIALMMAFGASYDRLRGIGGLGTFLDGMSAATVGVVGAVAVEMWRVAVKRKRDVAIALVAAITLSVSVLHLVEVVALAALAGALFLRPALPVREKSTPPADFPPASLRSVAVLPFALALAMPTALALFFVFARIGLVTFGGGAMIPAIEHEVVATRGWLSEPAFNDAMVLGQITPGPVAIASTFIGWRVAGFAGAALATLGMFAPPWVLTVIAGRSLAAFRANMVVQGALAGIAPAVVGVIVAAVVALARTSVHTPRGAAIAVGAFGLLVVARRTSPMVALALGGAVALGLRLWGGG
jgi:chromate transporter